MKTMKYIATVLMLLSMTSCELERLDYTEISPENFFKTETDLKLAVNSLYYDFNPGDFKAVYSADYMGYQVIGDMTTDVLWCCWAWGQMNFISNSGMLLWEAVFRIMLIRISSVIIFFRKHVIPFVVLRTLR